MPSNHETDSGAAQYYSHARPEVMALVPHEAERILDIGCGAGVLGAALKQRQECQVWGVEYVPAVAAKAEGRLERVVAGSIEDAEVLQALPRDYFDVLVLADLLEHLRDPGQTLVNLKACLRAGSTVVASVPNVRHWSVIKELLEGGWNYQEAGILDRTHLRFFTGSTLVTLFRDAGFDIAEAQGVGLVDAETMPAGLPDALAGFGIDAGTLARESEVYQFLLVARPALQATAPPGQEVAALVEETDVAHTTHLSAADKTLSTDPMPATNAVPTAAAVPAASFDNPVASLVMLTCNQLHFTQICIDSLFAYTHTPFELIVVDNGSTDGTLEYLDALVAADLPVRVIANPVNLGFGAGNNQGLAVARGDYIALINNDLVVTDGWLERMIDQLDQRAGVGIVGPRSNCVSGPQLIPDQAFDDFPQMHTEAARIAHEHAGDGQEFPRVVGFCMVIERAVIDAIGGFDEGFGLGNFEDDDLCWRSIIAGHRCLIANDAYVHHFGSRTFAGEQIDYERCMLSAWDHFKQKWGLSSELQLGEAYSITQPPFEPRLHRCELPQPGIVPMKLSREGAAELAARYNGWGERLYSRGRIEDALPYFERALALDGDCANALNNLGVLAVDRNDLEGAAGFFERSLANERDNLNTLWNLIALYVHLGRDEAALPLLQSYLHLNPSNSDGMALLEEITAATATTEAPLPT